MANLKVEVAISEGFGQKGQIQIPRFESFTPEERRVKIGCSLPQLGLQANREFLQAMVALWTENPVSFKGKFYEIPESMIGPKPLQRPHPPIYVGGSGKPALERTVKHGNGWNPSGIPSIEWLEAEIKQLRKLAGEAGRPSIDVVLRAIGMVLEQSGGPKRMPTVGMLSEIREDVRRLRDIGVTEIIFSPPEIGWINTPSIESGLGRLEQLIEISR